MQPLFTPGAQRAMQRAARLAQQAKSPAIEPLHLLWALFLDESRAAEIAAAHGLSHEILRRLLPLTAAEIAVETPVENTAEFVPESPPAQSPVQNPATRCAPS